MISSKTFLNNDITTVKSVIHEAIPITGSIVSGTYGAGAAFGGANSNVKFSSPLYGTIYDYPYLSASANMLFDMSVGFHATSTHYGQTQLTTTTGFRDDKTNMYNLLAAQCMGYDSTGSPQRFDSDGILVDDLNKMSDAVFFNIHKLIKKDEIKKGNFEIEIGTNAAHSSPFAKTVVLSDLSGANGYFTNGNIGQYGTLFLTNKVGTSAAKAPAQRAGVVFYQAGIAVVSGSVFESLLSSSVQMNDAGETWSQTITGSSITGNVGNVLHRIRNISMNNTSEINSTVYFCRANSGEFNYSANPTYLNSSKIRVKNEALDLPASYITTIGLYSSDNKLMAVAKLSEPIRKDPTTELTFRVRLDY